MTQLSSPISLQDYSLWLPQRSGRERSMLCCGSVSIRDVPRKSSSLCIAWIEKRLGRAALTRLLDDGPRAALIGELPE